MSKYPTAATSITTKHTGSDPKPESIRSELQALDSKLQRLSSDRVIQTSPYILTVPSERPYNLDKRLANEWKRGTPFDQDEEQLQYLSFLPEWDHGLITAVGAWDNEKGGMDSGRSTAGTPTVGAKKHKISLLEYKKKTTGHSGSLSTTAKEEDTRKRPNGTSSSLGEPAAPSGKVQPPKRPRDEGSGNWQLKADKSSQETPVSKKIKPSPSPSPAPVRRERERSPSPLDFPPDISPSLPPAIEKELKRLGSLSALDSKVNDKDQNKKKPVRESRTSSNDSNKDKLPSLNQSNGAIRQTASASRVERSTTLSGNPANTLGKPGDKLVIKKKIEPVLRKLVKLRIPKSLRPRYNLLMKTPQRRERIDINKLSTTTDSRDVTRKSIERDGLKGASKTVAPVSGDKRQRQDNEGEGSAPLSKRARAPSNLDVSKPTTPVPAAFKSPVVSHHGSAQKGKSTTPSMSHHDEVSTPQGAIRNGTPSAPDSVDRSNKDGRQHLTSSSSERASKDRLSALHRAQQAQHRLGRDLKHICDREFSKAKDSVQSKKKALALGIESVLCFMLSYAIRDEMNILARQGTRDPTWTTIFPLVAKTKHMAEPYPHLRGLCAQLEGVCHTAALNGELERERGQQHPKQSLSSDVLMKHYQSANELFIEGTAELSVDDLQHSFPNSWRQKARVPLAKPGGKFSMKVDGEFYLPLTSVTTGIEAVRAGKALLVEWCRMQGVQWEASIGTKPQPKDEGR